MVYKSIQLKLLKYYLVMVPILVVFVLTFNSQNIYGGGPTLDDKLRNMDAAMDHLVNVCEKETYKSMCLDTLEDAWWIDCAEWHDKLDTCKNGKVENLLKSHGRPT